MDVRALTEPPVLRVVSQQPPAQGNIKKKRASLSAVEAGAYGGGAGGGVLAQYVVDTSPITPEPVRTEFGNPNKIAQLFPELALQ
jgi:glutamine amidotransferase